MSCGGVLARSHRLKVGLARRGESLACMRFLSGGLYFVETVKVGFTKFSFSWTGMWASFPDVLNPFFRGF